VRVGGCMLNIPKGALKEKVRLKLVSHYRRNDEEVTPKQWRIKGGADWATARGPENLGSPQFLTRKRKCNM